MRMSVTNRLRFFAVCFCVLLSVSALAANRVATLVMDKNQTYQRITGFGGFVNSPQFQYNHMSAAEIRRLWGKNSETGYTMMRMYLPVGEANWPQSLATAKLAKELGVTLFASPWSPPAEWKTNGMVAGATVDANGNYQNIGSLKPEHYQDYAQYLNNYVVYLRTNGVELDGISIQNEPDYTVTYAGCLFTPAQMASFIKNYGHLISCPIIAAEGVGITDNYANALLADDVIGNLGIFGGHQYGAIQNAHKNFRSKGKEVWMTEFLINWNANKSEAESRNFSWSIDAFDFAEAVNTAMLSEVNAWIHYAAKRYYGMMGDGTRGFASGAITKRGYILSQFARFVTGTTRIRHSWNDESNTLSGSSYLSASGDSVVAVVINASNDTYTTTFDLPFYSTVAGRITTSASQNWSVSAYDFSAPTVRPKLEVPASSVSTFIFRRSADRPASAMTGAPRHYQTIEQQQPTSSVFGTSYRLSGSRRTFKHDSPLISSNTSLSNGYLALNHSFNKMVLDVRSMSTTGQLLSDNTTFHYLTTANSLASHNYGRVNIKREGDRLEFDISPNTLPGGCKGLVRISNSNYSSVLTLNLGDVYFTMGNEQRYRFGGIYSPEDTYLLNCLDDNAFTGLDFTETTGIPVQANWHEIAANKNCVFYVPHNSAVTGTNIIRDNTTHLLSLNDTTGNFFLEHPVDARQVSYSFSISGYKLVSIPFEAEVPQGLTVYSVALTAGEVQASELTARKLPANVPVLVKGSGRFTLTGSGAVATPYQVQNAGFNASYIAVGLHAGDYVLAEEAGGPVFVKVQAGEPVTLKPFTGYLAAGHYAGATVPVIVKNATGTSNGTASAEITGRWYYTIHGIPIAEEELKTGNVYIVRTVFADGSSKHEKIVAILIEN